MTREEERLQEARDRKPTGNGTLFERNDSGEPCEKIIVRLEKPGVIFPHAQARSSAYRWGEDGIEFLITISVFSLRSRFGMVRMRF